MFYGWIRKIPHGRWGHFASSDSYYECLHQTQQWALDDFAGSAYSIVVLPNDVPPENLKRKKQ